MLNAGFTELPGLLSPVLQNTDSTKEKDLPKLSGLKILDQIVKIDHITTKSISKDKFLQKCITNTEQFKEVIKISLLKSMLFPGIFTDASFELISLGVSLYSLSSNLKAGNYADSGAQLWQILSEIKDIPIEGVDNSSLMKADFSKCQQTWLTERAASFRTQGKRWDESTTKKIREICLST